MIGKFPVKFLIIIPLFIRGLHGAIINGYEDTSDGNKSKFCNDYFAKHATKELYNEFHSCYCDLDGFGRIPVGQYGEHFEICQQAYCGENFYRIETCGSVGTSSPECKVKDKAGSYPKCCPDVQCNEWINRNKKWLCEWCDMRTSRRG